MAAFESRIVGVEALCPMVRLLRFRPADGEAFDYCPGQYVWVEAVGPDRASRRAAFSLCLPPQPDGEFALCVRQTDKDDCATLLSSMGAGDVVRAEGPHGSLCLDQPLETSLLLVATGTGVAPFRAMLEQLRTALSRVDVWLVVGARTRSELLFDADWRALAEEQARFRYLPVVSGAPSVQPTPGSSPTCSEDSTSRVTRLLDQLPELPHEPLVAYVCGHSEMVRDVSQELSQRGIPSDHIRTER